MPLAVTLLCQPGLAAAAAWTASTAQGQTVRIMQDSFRMRDGYLLERIYPDGSIDPAFGQQGVTAFRLGPDNEGPATLRLDGIGRLWVAGAALGPDGRGQAVVMRFTPQGLLDPTYAKQGRSATAPAAMQARALDLLPAPDGSTWVNGLIINAEGQERSGLWRLNSDGQVDTRFADGGLWVDQGVGETEALAFEQAPDGSLALGLRRGQGDAATLEIWSLTAGQSLPQLAQRVGGGGQAAARLVWREGRWQWLDAKGQVLPISAEFAPLRSASASAADAQAPASALAPDKPPPLAEGVSAAAGAAADDSGWWWPGAALLVGLAFFWFARRRRQRRRA
ncbi:delta-60 repeat domain-containing protein [Roseateles oligotrophus]|uniref:Delta-60 repeat domain-containing protein n=1 Tax=Roseateles oligotrophus TaxID=1769250 RepID=A0ABT2Y9H2_9BURK|nr:delta-60 repeat domain-containing protein [Roseateles oligotrophus]MCV2366951.1 delta-60 repeat domain-containing protein [Roseateles oligotrophus]